jgi:hypothetical protein
MPRARVLPQQSLQYDASSAASYTSVIVGLLNTQALKLPGNVFRRKRFEDAAFDIGHLQPYGACFPVEYAFRIKNHRASISWVSACVNDTARLSRLSSECASVEFPW